MSSSAEAHAADPGHPAGSRTASVTSDPVDLFLELAAIPSPPGHERSVADHVRSFIDTLGVDAWEDDAATGLCGSTGNLVVRAPATRAGTPVFFCAHLDTVPVSGPIEPVIVDGVVSSSGQTILGADNKASVAAMLIALKRVIEEKREHAGIELVLTPMEEVGCKGAKAFDSSVLRAKCGFVYDHEGAIGTYVQAAPAGQLMNIRFAGRAAHAGIDPERGRSAIQAAGRAIAALELGLHADASTVNAGVIHGGVAHNVVAEHCSLAVDIRARSHRRALELVDEITAAARRSAADAGCTAHVEVEEKYRDYRLEPDDSIVALAHTALRAIGATPLPLPGGGGADASVFNARGIPCLNFGSGMRAVHTHQETIATADIYRLVDLTLALIAAA